MDDATASREGISSELLFSTPVFRERCKDHDELNAALRHLILSRERSETRGTRRYSNVGGWHSPIDLQESWEPEFRVVLERARELAKTATAKLLPVGEQDIRYRYALSAWANVSRAGDYNVPHVHMATWSAVYYVSVPEPEPGNPDSGGLELIDPRPATAMIDMPGPFFATRHFIKPEAGVLVLFPASVMHFVHPFRAAGERISIACDLTFQQA